MKTFFTLWKEAQESKFGGLFFGFVGGLVILIGLWVLALIQLVF